MDLKQIMYCDQDITSSINFECDLFGDLPKEFIPLSTIGPPERTNFTGIYNFIVEIDGSHTHKKKYLYSYLVNRIYVNMDCDFSVNFKWDRNQDDEPLYVRATTVFSELAQAQKRVERCIQHSHESFNSAHDARTEQHVIKNVLRSARAEGGAGVYYCGCADDPDSWYSVLVRFAAPAPHAFHFVCKNSCTSGINRRPVDLIFTLEDLNGRVLGRQSVGARICSCPRRDMVNDEKQAPAGKRALPTPAVLITPATPDTPAAPPPAKRRMREVADEDEIITLPSMQVVGRRSAVAGLTMMINMMKQSRGVKVNANQSVEVHNKHINILKNLVDNL